jgi:hypothetical protein
VQERRIWNENRDYEKGKEAEMQRSYGGGFHSQNRLKRINSTHERRDSKVWHKMKREGMLTQHESSLLKWYCSKDCQDKFTFWLLKFF